MRRWAFYAEADSNPRRHSSRGKGRREERQGNVKVPVTFYPVGGLEGGVVHCYPMLWNAVLLVQCIRRHDRDGVLLAFQEGGREESQSCIVLIQSKATARGLALAWKTRVFVTTVHL